MSSQEAGLLARASPRVLATIGRPVSGFIDQLSGGQVTSVKVVLTTVLVVLAVYQLCLAAVFYKKGRVPVLAGRVAARTRTVSAAAGRARIKPVGGTCCRTNWLRSGDAGNLSDSARVCIIDMNYAFRRGRSVSACDGVDSKPVPIVPSHTNMEELVKQSEIKEATIYLRRLR